MKPNLVASILVTLLVTPNVMANRNVRIATANLPLSFERNDGQFQENIKFLARTDHFLLALESKSVFFQTQSGCSLNMTFQGSNASPVVGDDALAGKANYFIGSDPINWRTDIPTFKKVRYTEVYPGIDLIFYGRNGQLEYDFIVAPGAQPKSIRTRFVGTSKVRLEKNGDLMVALSGCSELVVLHKPIAYQEIQGKRHQVTGRYVVERDQIVRIELSRYESSAVLVIDPVLSYSTYLGGSAADSASDVFIDAMGNAYVTGSTISVDFPTLNPLQGSYRGGTCPFFIGGPRPCSDAFVLKVDPTGSRLLYATYFGGSAHELGFGVVADLDNNAYIVGTTTSTDLPTRMAFQPNPGGGTCGGFPCQDMFIAKIGPSGSNLVFSTYFGGPANETANAVTISPLGIHVVGSTNGSGFPILNAVQSSFAGGTDNIVALIDFSPKVVYATYLGGSGLDLPSDIAVDDQANVYITGMTDSTNFPVLNAIQNTYGGGSCGGGEVFIACRDAFVTKLNRFGNALEFSTFLGGNRDDAGAGIVWYRGVVHVAGGTSSPNFPVTPGVFQSSMNGGQDAFIVGIGQWGSPLIYSTFFGGSAGEGIAKIVANRITGQISVAGSTSSLDLPLKQAIQTAPGGGTCKDDLLGVIVLPCLDGFVATFDPRGRTLLFSTYLGGPQNDRAAGIGIDGLGNLIITGTSESPFYPTFNALQNSLRGTSDAVLTKIGNCRVQLPLQITNLGPNLSTAMGISANCPVFGKWVLGVLIFSTEGTGFFAQSLHTGFITPFTPRERISLVNPGQNQNSVVAIINAFLTLRNEVISYQIQGYPDHQDSRLTDLPIFLNRLFAGALAGAH